MSVEPIAVGQQQVLEDGKIEVRADVELEKQTTEINTHSFFSYKPGNNHIKIELFDSKDPNEVIAETVIAMSSIPLDKFAARRFIFRNKNFFENVNSYNHSLTRIKVSFYLETARQANQKELSRSLMMIQKKMPDRVDIFNQSSNEELNAYF